MTKTCSKCGKQKRASAHNFYRDSRRDKPGAPAFNPWCKSCHKAHSRANNAARKARILARQQTISTTPATASVTAKPIGHELMSRSRGLADKIVVTLEDGVGSTTDLTKIYGMATTLKTLLDLVEVAKS